MMDAFEFHAPDLSRDTTTALDVPVRLRGLWRARAVGRGVPARFARIAPQELREHQ